MAENGKGLFTFVGSIVAGVLGVVVVIFNLVYSPLSSAICDEAKTRATENESIRKEIEKKLDSLLTYAMDTKEKLATNTEKVNEATARIGRLENRSNR